MYTYMYIYPDRNGSRKPAMYPRLTIPMHELTRDVFLARAGALTYPSRAQRIGV